MIIAEKVSIIDVMIIVSTIIAKEHDFSIKWDREEMYAVRIDIDILCDNEHELIWDLIKQSDLIINKRWTMIW